MKISKISSIKWPRLRGLALAILCELHAVCAFGQVSPDGTIALRGTPTGGGGRSVGAAFVIRSSLGQPFAGAAGAGPFQLAAGFWPAATEVPTDESPFLRITPKGADRIVVSWPGEARGFRLQSTPLFGRGANWTDVEVAAVLSRGEWAVELARDQRIQFFRLLGKR